MQVSRNVTGIWPNQTRCLIAEQVFQKQIRLQIDVLNMVRLAMQIKLASGHKVSYCQHYTIHFIGNN